MQSTDPYVQTLVAGALRDKAARLIHEAEVVEGNIRMALGLDGSMSANSQTLVPGTVLCVTHDERPPMARRVPFDAMQGITLIPEGEVTPAHYDAVVIIQLQTFYVAALVVPKGKRNQAILELAEINGAQGIDEHPIAKAMSRMLIDGVGFNTEMVVGVILQLAKGAQGFVNTEVDTAMMLKIN